MFRNEERMGIRMYIDKIFERATIKGIADYLLFGIGPDEDNRSYEERLEEPFRRFEKAVAKYDKSPTSELLDLSNECFLASNFPHFHRYDSLKSALYIHAVSKNINTFPKNQGRIRAAIAVEILDFTVMYR